MCGRVRGWPDYQGLLLLARDVLLRSLVLCRRRRRGPLGGIDVYIQTRIVRMRFIRESSAITGGARERGLNCALYENQM